MGCLHCSKSCKTVPCSVWCLVTGLAAGVEEGSGDYKGWGAEIGVDDEDLQGTELGSTVQIVSSRVVPR